MTQIHEIHPLVKEELLRIYQAIREICQKHDFKYSAAFGTMLGAVRHRGFIPWDDDLDLFMLRDDYERFLEIAVQELPAQLKLVTFNNTREYPAIFCKVQECDRVIYERIRKEANYINPHGLYVDIFPLDGVPTGIDSWLDFLRCACAFCRRSHLQRKGIHSGLKGRLVGLLGMLLAPAFQKQKSDNDFAKQLDCWAKNTPPLSGKEIRYTSCEGRFQKKELHFPRHVFEAFEDVPFENTSIPVPREYDIALKVLYGPDYMTPPPLEKRVSEHSKVPEAPWIYGPTGGAN